jgi:hypothetical protein
MWSNETISVRGQLVANPTETTFTGSVYAKIPSDMHPGMPNENVTISFTKPDFTSYNVTAKTDNRGYFTISTVPTEVGQWGWVAFYDGFVKQSIVYEDSFTTYSTFEVVPAPVEPTPPPTIVETPTPTPVETATPEVTATPAATATESTTYTAFPMEYVYAIIAAVVIVIAVVAVYAMRKKQAS